MDTYKEAIIKQLAANMWRRDPETSNWTGEKDGLNNKAIESEYRYSQKVEGNKREKHCYISRNRHREGIKHKEDTHRQEETVI